MLRCVISWGRCWCRKLCSSWGWWRSVESSAGDDGDSPLVEVGLLLSSRQGKVHLKMSYYESTDNDDDSHSEEEIGPAGVEVHWQLYQWARVSWEVKIIIQVNRTISITFKSKKTKQWNLRKELHSACCYFPFFLRDNTFWILKATLVGATSGKTKSTVRKHSLTEGNTNWNIILTFNTTLTLRVP